MRAPGGRPACLHDAGDAAAATGAGPGVLAEGVAVHLLDGGTDLLLNAADHLLKAAAHAAGAEERCMQRGRHCWMRICHRAKHATRHEPIGFVCHSPNMLPALWLHLRPQL